jgi:hypothetical protein
VTLAEITSVRLAVTVHDDRPGSLTSHLRRLERVWRSANNSSSTVRSCSFDPAELDSVNLDDCERCDRHWSRCTCGSP